MQAINERYKYDLKGARRTIQFLKTLINIISKGLPSLLLKSKDGFFKSKFGNEYFFPTFQSQHFNVKMAFRRLIFKNVGNE